MRWWTPLALLVCLVVGYVLGSVDADRGAGRARQADGARTPADRMAPADRSPEPAPMGSAPSDLVPSDIAGVAPGPEVPPDEELAGDGVLVVNFKGFDGPAWVRLESVDPEGKYDYMEREADEDTEAWIELAPGEVTVRWESCGATRRFAARARIEAGRVTRLVASDPRYGPLPEPPLLAILDVRVTGPDGQGLGDAAVHLGGAVLEGQHWVTLSTDAEGRARFRVRSGSYEVQAGGERIETVSLKAPERRTIELRHDACGMVVVDPALEGIYTLHPREGGNAPMEGAYHEGQSVRFLFVPAGSYELWYQFSSSEYVVFPAMGNSPGTAAPARRLLATLEARPGRTERIEHCPEPGSLEVEVDAPASSPGARWQMRIRRQGDDANTLGCELNVDRGRLRTETGTLAKGIYGVEIVVDGKVVAERHALVAYGSTKLEVTIPR